MYTHIVFFILNDPADAPAFEERLLALGDQIDALKEVEVGVDDAPSARSAHLCLITRFDDAHGLEVYRVHPKHEAFLQWARPRVTRTLKVDYAR